jgi:hypothetical protein
MDPKLSWQRRYVMRLEFFFLSVVYSLVGAVGALGLVYGIGVVWSMFNG